VRAVRAGDHVDVHAGRDRLGGRVPQIGGNTLVDQLADAVPVGNDDTVEAPLVLEHFSQQSTVGVHGHAVDIGEGRHDGGAPGLHRRPERTKVKVAQGVLADLHGLVVAATPDQPVTDEVLGARRDRPGAPRAGIACAGNAKGFALEAAHHRRAESTGQHRCLAKGLGDPAPSRLFGDVQHRGERPGDSVNARFGGGEARGPAYEVHDRDAHAEAQPGQRHHRARRG
jgi:hypothetical protein